LDEAHNRIRPDDGELQQRLDDLYQDMEQIYDEIGRFEEVARFQGGQKIIVRDIPEFRNIINDLVNDLASLQSH